MRAFHHRHHPRHNRRRCSRSHKSVRGIHSTPVHHQTFCSEAHKAIPIERERDMYRQCPASTRTRPATRYFFRYLTRPNSVFQVAGNPKHRVLPDISGKPEILGTTRNFGYYPIFRVSPIRGKQYHHQVLFFGNHKKDPRVQKSAKSAILTSSMTVELLLVGQSMFKTYDL